MIDLHCHILPGIDDGALDLADSLAMARIGAADGIEVIAATPHIRHDHDVRIGELSGRVEELNEELRSAEVPVAIVTGGEVAEPALDGLDETRNCAQSHSAGPAGFCSSRGPVPLGDPLLEAVDRLHESGFRALIAHPERHLSDDISERIGTLIDRGALVQATAAYLCRSGHARGCSRSRGAG